MYYEKAAKEILSTVKKMNRDFKVPEAVEWTKAEMPDFDKAPTGKGSTPSGDGNDKEPGGTQSYQGNPDTYLGSGSGPTYGDVQGGNWA